MMKFIHTADLHLDRAFEGLVQETAFQPYHILEKIVDLAISEAVEVVFFAGDNFHQSQPSIKIQNYFVEQLTRLQVFDIQAVVIFGNHDYYRESVYWIDFPENVTVFKSETVTTQKLTLKTGETLAVSGFSYQHPHLSVNKVAEYPIRDYTCDYHIGIFHGAFSGQSFAPATLTDMLAKSYNYWALGHIHLANQVADTIIYPGTPQGRNKKESTNLVVLGEMAPTGNLIYFHDLAEVHFETLRLDLSTCQSLAQALTFIKSQLSNAANFYSLELENYDAIVDNLQEAIDNDELLEELRQHHIIIKLKLMPLTLETGQLNKIDVPDFQLPELDFEQIYSLLPHQEDVRAIFEDSDFRAEVEEHLTLFASQNFEFGGYGNEN